MVMDSYESDQTVATV